MLLVHQVAYLVDHGIPSLMAASVVSVIGITSVCGKIGGGWVSDFVDRRVTYTIGTTFTAASIGALGLLALHPAPGWAYLYGVLIGVGYSIPAAITPALLSDVFRGRHFGAIFGSFQIASALGGAAGPWVAGRVFDVTGSYAPAFLAAVGAAGAATAALWGTRRRAR
jgi:MFS family permease